MLCSSLLWKLFGGSALLIAAFMAIFVLVVTPWQQKQIEDQLSRRLEDNALLLQSQASLILGQQQADLPRVKMQPTDLPGLVRQLSRETDLRITIIATDGNVLADSHKDIAVMENHAARPEVLVALREGVGRARRDSSTTGFEMMYVARRVGPASAPLAIVRVSVATGPLDAQLAATRTVILEVAVAFAALALVLSFFVAARVTRPLVQLTEAAEAVLRGDYQGSPQVDNRREFGALFGAFQQLGRQLASRLDEVRRQAQQLETVLGGMEEGVIAVNAQRRVLFANEAARKLLSREDTNLIDRPLWELIRHPAVEQAVTEALEHTQPRHCEFDLHGASRQWVDLQVSCLPGRPCPGLVLVLNDVTELRKLERLRRDFLANVSHELKTPLSSIKAYSETLLGGALHDNDHNQLFLQRINAQALRLENIILDMLSLSRIESGQQAFKLAPLPLARIVDESLILHAAEAQAKSITLTAQTPDEPPPNEPLAVMAEEEGLREILDNLLINAIKYTPQGGRVTVRWLRNGEFVTLQVEDTGLGIAEAEQERIFERFYRVDKARSRELGGTGLGLSIVKHLASAFGGSVGVKSQLGQGSLFFVKLRVADEKAAPAKDATEAA